MATIHTFTGNEVIATEVPKYLNDNFSALNTETDNLSKSVVKTVNGTSPVNGNVNIVGFDSYWEANEQVSVGEIRVPKGRENSGLFFECVKAGTTGSSQPEVDTAILADFSDVGRIGQVRWIYNIAEKDDDEIFATGVKYSRATYSALWEYVRSKPALLISESEWQAKYQETGGKFVPYYSEGDGSTDFRTPLLCAYATGVADNSKIGTFQEAGLPNITGEGKFLADWINAWTGCFSNSTTYSEGASNKDTGTYLKFDASLSNPIYGKSDTVTPDTMYGVWVIKAFGVIVNSDNTELSNVLINIENNNEKISDFETNYDFVVESWRDGTSWYRKYKSGWVEQGGFIPYRVAGWVTVSLYVPYQTTYYSLSGGGHTNDTSCSTNPFKVSFKDKTTTQFMTAYSDDNTLNAGAWTWYACGQGA